MSNNARTGQLLAINGGEPCIEAELPHWHWPTTTEDDVDAVINELKHNKKNLSGYSEAVSVFEKNVNTGAITSSPCLMPTAQSAA